MIFSIQPFLNKRNWLAPFNLKLATSTSITNSWGFFPQISFISGLGMLMLALANTASRLSAGWAPLVFWLSLLIIFAPIAFRLLTKEARGRERVCLVAMLGVELNLVKVLQSPVYLTYHDELLHWKTANDIALTQHLFSENSLLPVSPLYPGLELMTNALNSLSGLPIFYCGLIIVALCRLIFVLAFYFLFSQIGRSERVGSIAVLLYATNPNFVFFDSQFSYESVALSFAAFCLMAIAMRSWMPEKGRVGLNLAVLLGIAATTVSHHLTSYALEAFLAMWVVCSFPKKWRQENRVVPSGTALVLLTAILAWLVFVANLVVGYLSPIFGQALQQVLQLIAGEATSRQFFKDQSGEVAAAWEQYMGLGSTALIILGLPFGIVALWGKFRNSAVAWVLTLWGIGYPLSLGLRFTQAGAEVASRAGGFLLIGSSFVLAVGFVYFEPELLQPWLKFFLGWFPWLVKRLTLLISFIFRKFSWLRQPVQSFWLIVLFMGGIIVGGGPAWARMPGPYLVGADMRSIDTESILTSSWSLNYLGPNNHIASDRINRLLNGTYGRQRPITLLGDQIDVSRLFTNIEFGNYEYSLLQQGQLHYLIVDSRLSTGLPHLGIYFEQGEPNSNNHKEPIKLQALHKYDRMDKVSRVYDSGDIVIYDVSVLTKDGPANN